VRLDIGAATSRGKQRDRNEDSFLVQRSCWCNKDQRHEAALVVVADGMGGHESGDRASALVVRTMGRVLNPLLDGYLSGQFEKASPTDLANAVDVAIREANRVVRRATGTAKGRNVMGSTLGSGLIWDGHVFIGHVGDCRVYHQRSGKLAQITTDQTLVMRMVELGQLTLKEAKTHKTRNEVTQAIGLRADLKPARYQLTLARGDWLVFASDGLHTHVDDDKIQDVTRRSGAAAPLAEHLVDLAEKGGGSDNITVIAVRCY
jgi:protein phosphatase